ncbi:uncharacterized protein BDR25DRAFT_360305 [Lindgomyces ingoldianus]|uniref:Uncharacterized protein n=1 Tax=Lindgomyces ingoldianus TaxID=673940 RepID=A0ACB6QFI3_9PLEO|nr:uncharacterized protein BDR25DRAFT_360305 [Lindgomyces ingoldianus]KAF2465779.1 hypothetical protein BDR25DRAFT_360305 [Lindgomyces ingoldianus]
MPAFSSIYLSQWLSFSTTAAVKFIKLATLISFLDILNPSNNHLFMSVLPRLELDHENGITQLSGCGGVIVSERYFRQRFVAVLSTPVELRRGEFGS